MSSADGRKEGWSEAFLAHRLIIGTIPETAHVGDEMAPLESSAWGPREERGEIHRNRYFEGMDDRQKTPRGHPNFDSYIENLPVLVFRMDRRTDGQRN